MLGARPSANDAVSRFLATTVPWIIVNEVGDANPIRAIGSMVATSSPEVKQALSTLRGRILNTPIACAAGLPCVWFGHTAWELPFAPALAVILSSDVVRIPAMWRQAPITAAIVVSGTLQHQSRLTRMDQGLRRVVEVLFGCGVGIVVAWALSRPWPEPVKPGSGPG